FFYWLYNQSQALQEQVTPTMADSAEQGPPPVTLALLGSQPDSLPGRSATLDSVKVADRLGRGVFVLSVNDSTGYPILLATQLIQKGTTVYQDDRVNVGGKFYPLNDSIRSEWVKRGAVDSASADRLPAAPSFMLADTVGILRSDHG
ncbi:MAG TPA: hypothetical protein VKA44_08840, partial [Gemmatimonadota bacterium]|nr:hypothetical protein [Gemmatimonadota bacterium]